MKSLRHKMNIKIQYTMFPPGIELWAFRVLGVYDNFNTTGTRQKKFARKINSSDNLTSSGARPSAMQTQVQQTMATEFA
jgi:hypothetical protein